MILVVGPDAEALDVIVSNLRARMPRPVFGVDDGAVALRVLELNPVDTVILDLRKFNRGWLRTFRHRSQSTRCIVLCDGARDIRDAEAFLPESAILLRTPLDWEEVAAIAASEQKVAEDNTGIIAVGLEDVLTLLSMTKANMRVQVTAGLKRGCLLVRGGTIVHAERNDRVGEDVAYEIMSWLDPQVSTRPLTAASHPETMNVPIAALLHEAARRHDELSRLSSTREVQDILDELATAPHVVGLTLLQVDNAQTLTTRGSEEVHLRPEVMRAAADAAAFWAPPESNGRRGRGAVFWTDDTVNISVPVNWQLVLTVLGRGVVDFDAFRRRVAAGAEALFDVAEERFAGRTMAAVNALPW